MYSVALAWVEDAYKKIDERDSNGKHYLGASWMVTRMAGSEVQVANILMLRQDWSTLESFLKQRLTLRLPPLRKDADRRDVEAVSIRQQTLNLIAQVAKTRSHVPKEEFDRLKAAEPALTELDLTLKLLIQSAHEAITPAEGNLAENSTVGATQVANGQKRQNIDRARALKAAQSSKSDLESHFSGLQCIKPAWLSARPNTPGQKDALPMDINILVGNFETLAAAEDAARLLEDNNLLDQAFVLLETLNALEQEMLGAASNRALEVRAALARLQLRRNRLPEAQALWSGWVEASQRALSEELWMVDQATRLKVLRNNRRNVDAFLATLVLSDAPDAARQVLGLSIARKGLLARIASETHALARTSTDPSTRDLVEQFETQRRYLAQMAYKTSTNSPEWQRERQKVDSLAAALSSNVRSRRSPAALADLAELRLALAADEALVDFSVFRAPATAAVPEPPQQMVAVVLRREGEPKLLHWPDLNALTRAVENSVNSVGTSPQEAANYAASMREIARLLWSPIARQLQGIKRVSLVADGILSLIPFHALPTPQGGYLTGDLELYQLTSVRDLALEPRKDRAGKSLIIGAPDFGANGQSATRGSRTAAVRLQDVYFSPLPGALEESRMVESIVKKAMPTDLLTGPLATKSALYKIAGPAVLHLATHGFFLEQVTQAETTEDPMQALAHAGIALANANLVARKAAGSEEGILTALEAATLDLRGTRLVVLSACETGLGQIEIGEGVHGMVRALNEAGALSVMATLWPIDDIGTREFMLAFYRRFAAGSSPHDALRATQQEFIASREWSNPYFWAPFVLSGR
jgi:CHAT domain-containing protein